MVGSYLLFGGREPDRYARQQQLPRIKWVLSGTGFGQIEEALQSPQKKKHISPKIKLRAMTLLA